MYCNQYELKSNLYEHRYAPLVKMKKKKKYTICRFTISLVELSRASNLSYSQLQSTKSELFLSVTIIIHVSGFLYRPSVPQIEFIPVLCLAGKSDNDDAPSTGHLPYHTYLTIHSISVNNNGESIFEVIIASNYE